ncbi:MAG: DUF998 domain-containing protein [Betaproteobacteria bacterium]|nr:MAG: DUF998 domain-containing protein [Betaproteobacteria bacterium]
MRFTRLGVAIFAAAVVAGPLYTVPGYSPVANLISELGAQNTPRNYIMVVAFAALGAGIVADGVRTFHRALVPFVAFGFFMALVGLFGHKPIHPDIPYVTWAHTAHVGLATAAGISVTVGFAWQAFRQPGAGMRTAAALLAVVSLAMPLAMLAFPAYQGAIQRVMYFLVFLWLWVCYPQRTHA